LEPVCVQNTGMKVLWNYLKPHSKLVFVSLTLAAASQVLNMIDPLIFGKIIDDYTTNPHNLSQSELLQGITFWLGTAVAIALLSRAAKAFQEYTTRLVVQKFGMQVFNDGLKHTLRLSFQEYEEQRSGETMALLQKVRTDTERFINAFINIVFSSLVGVAFLLWYAVTKHWALIPVFFVGVFVLGGLTGLLSKKIKTIQRAVNRETVKMSGSITESLRNIELVKSLGLTFPEIKRLREQTQKIFMLEMQKVNACARFPFCREVHSVS
jgi:ATP-binding cassette, subfamily B, bacterial